MGIASLILGIICIIISVIPSMVAITIILFFVGGILGIVDICAKTKTKNQAITGLILVIIAFFIAFINIISSSSISLNQKVATGRLSYYIQKDWKSKEDIVENTMYRYYYPTDDTTLMIMLKKDINNTNFENFLDDFISGMSLKEDEFISKEIKNINGNKYGIVKFYTYIDNKKYEAINYITISKNECYSFAFIQENKLEDKSISLIKDIVSKIEIQTETREEKQARIEKEIAEKKAQKEQEENNYKANCRQYTYKEIARNPNNYNGKKVVFTGRVIQVQEESSKSIILRVNVTKDKYGLYEDTIYCTYTYSNNESKVLENDIITLYGECKGDITYISLFGQSVTIPNVEIKYLNINE